MVLDTTDDLINVAATSKGVEAQKKRGMIDDRTSSSSSGKELQGREREISTGGREL